MTLVSLSPELDHRWLFPARRLRIRMRHPLAGEAFTVPMTATIHQLHRSPAYQAVAPLLRSDVLDSWDENGWRMLTYTARHHDQPVTTVFAVRVAEYDPHRVRAVLADAVDNSVLWRFEPGPRPETSPSPSTPVGLPGLRFA